MSIKLFDLLPERVASVLRPIGPKLSWRRSAFIGYTIGALGLLTSCASPNESNEINLESETFLAALTATLKSDQLFETRTRCFFLLMEGGKEENIQDSSNPKILAFRSILEKKKLYKNNPSCRDYNWSDSKAKTFGSWINSDGSARTFVDSPEFMLGVSIFVRNRKFVPDQIYTTFDEYTRVLKKTRAYCETNKCPPDEMMNVTISNVEFAMCNSPIFTIWAIDNRVIEYGNSAIAACVN